jgi:hypothetical protein
VLEESVSRRTQNNPWKRRLTLSVILIERNYFVHRCFRSIATSLGLLDLFRVSALLDDKIENVEHFGNRVALSRAAKREMRGDLKGSKF